MLVADQIGRVLVGRLIGLLFLGFVPGTEPGAQLLGQEAGEG
ncbi:hypothetical protein [Streptomyces sediminimaris]